MTQIEWVIFDLGAVLIDWNPRYAYGRATKDLEKIEYFIRHVATSEWNSQMDAGIPFQRAIDRRVQEFPDWGEWLQKWRDDWPTMLHAPIDDSVSIFKDVVARRRDGHLKGVIALSNWEAGTFKIAQARFPFLKDFDARLISGEERLIKPNPDFFRLLETRHGVNPKRAIFIDDLAKNTQVAEDLGYQVHVFESASKLRTDLEGRAVLVRS